MDEAETHSGKRRIGDRVKGILVLESIAIGIALALPITPSKTGSSSWSPAELFTANPNYLQEVLAAFVLGNVIFVFLGLMIWLVSRNDRPD